MRKNTVTTMVANDAPAITKPKLTNCAAPAKITADMAMACATLKPVFMAIEPASKPHGITAMDKGIIAIIPCQNKVRLGVDAACKGSVWLLIGDFRWVKRQYVVVEWVLSCTKLRVNAIALI